MINPISNTNLNINLYPTLTITVSVTNSVAANSLIWGLGSGAPSGASIASGNLPNNAVFTWTPTTAQAPSTNSITVTVHDTSFLYSDATSFTVTVVTNIIPPVTQIVIDTIPPQTVAEGTTLIFTNYAHATDNTNNPLLFSLLNPPNGATLTNNSSTSGVFTWTPTSAQAETPSYTIREIVTEPGTSGSNYQDFQVTVTRTNDCAQLDEFLAAVQRGGYFLLSDCTTIVLTNTLIISNNVTLDGGTQNPTIAGNNLVQLFTVMPGVTNFTLRGLTLSGGQAAIGGGLYISAGATVMLTNCTFAGNGALGANGSAGYDGSGGGGFGKSGSDGTAGALALGGAIYNLGTLAIFNCSFLTNSATGGSGGNGGNGSDGSVQGGNGGNGGAGAVGYGGAIYNQGTLQLTNCTFAGNTATGGSGGSGGANGAGAFPGDAGSGGAGASGYGAAVYSAQSLTFASCTFAANAAQSGNSAGGGTNPSTGNGVNGPRGPDSLGGGVFSYGNGTFTNCTFYDNSVTAGNGGNGGDAYSIGAHIAGNGGNGGNGSGGGLYNWGAAAVVNCTFSGCGATGGTNGAAGNATFPASAGSPGYGLGGDIANGVGTFTLQNSILAASSAGGNGYAAPGYPISDYGYNISSDASLYLSGTSLRNTDPQIGTLADNGGLTPTIALLTNSPALDRIPPNLSPPTDQRGVLRPQGTASDVGAYELVVTLLPVAATIRISLSAGTGVSINFTGQAGLNYELEYKNALSDSAWTLLPPVMPGTSGLMVLQDTNAPIASRYYRVLYE